MSINFYMDVHVRRAVTEGLRLREVDVLTAQEDGAGEFSDPNLRSCLCIETGAFHPR
ncbi:MAG: hypothetical protein WKF84_24770 [Pyrinomonadaceae bacterium]